MKCVIVTLAVLLTAAVTAHEEDQTCIAEHCHMDIEPCENDTKCTNALLCIFECLVLRPLDKTPQKLIVQNCTNICVFSYVESPTDPYVQLMTCMTENNCLTLRPIPDPCRRNITVKAVSISTLRGTWWSVRGYNLAYDCYPCQRNTFGKLDMDAKVKYDATFEIITVNGSRKQENSTAFLMITTDYKAGYKMNLTIAGMPSKERWWIVDAVESGGDTYILVYYCAQSLQWHSDGAMVFSRTKELSPTAEPAISAAYKAALGPDFDLDNFCENDNTRCMQ